jgi:integrase
MLADWTSGKRQFRCYSDPTKATDEADRLAKLLSQRSVMAASMSETQAIEYAASVMALANTGLSVQAACTHVAEWVKTVGNVQVVQDAISYYRQHHKQLVKMGLYDAVEEYLKVKEARGLAQRSVDDLSSRLDRFCQYHVNLNVDVITGSVIQDWLDNLDVAPQTYVNFRRVLYGFFRFAMKRNWIQDNPVVDVELVKVKAGDIQIFTPEQMVRLLKACREKYPDYLAAMAIGAFAGVRSNEILRLEWSDIDRKQRHIVIAASRSKTASRRLAPITDNLDAWLEVAEHIARKGTRVWNWPAHWFYRRQEEVAGATEVKEADGLKAVAPVKWMNNALRHSFASYRYSALQDAGKVAAEMGNSAQMLFKHYREMVTPKQAVAWFGIMPQAPANVVSLARAATA